MLLVFAHSPYQITGLQFTNSTVKTYHSMIRQGGKSSNFFRKLMNLKPYDLNDFTHIL